MVVTDPCAAHRESAVIARCVHAIPNPEEPPSGAVVAALRQEETQAVRQVHSEVLRRTRQQIFYLGIWIRKQ